MKITTLDARAREARFFVPDIPRVWNIPPPTNGLRAIERVYRPPSQSLKAAKTAVKSTVYP
jgi:hypothetical protein